MRFAQGIRVAEFWPTVAGRLPLRPATPRCRFVPQRPACPRFQEDEGKLEFSPYIRDHSSMTARECAQKLLAAALLDEVETDWAEVQRLNRTIDAPNIIP